MGNKEYCEEFYANKFDNLNKMNKPLEKHKPPKLTQEQMYSITIYLLKNL